MKLHVLEASMVVPLPIEQVFPFFAAAENLQRITPPSLRFSILSPLPVDMRRGALIDYRLRLMGIPFGWKTEITTWDPPREFVDEQLKGPYRVWRHRHRFRTVAGGTGIEDRVEYALPFGPLGLVALPLVKRQLRAIFAHRQRVVAQLLMEGS
ncbi:MAG TPA: SRPBCC family protein [Longimicrobiales bacterium]